MRKSDQFLFFTAFNVALFVLMLLHSHHGQAAAHVERQERIKLVRELMLTDLCLFTEARYTRHPSMADLHSPFQDHPLSLEHFPSGSFLSPPTPYAR
ncbi:hypothetical protein [Geobacter sp. AOG2]|uniref:hypothetical protein n=1 Tax=Geobacter sp. AOG2 TaxID=1566347 RepID=UPI001CC4CCB7|nr:hypothetical protein [Geobacter sp. AOG2]GFE61167.1 hypothetical protein AOG2_17540 [Geobacter sp. AOG2]